MKNSSLWAPWRIKYLRDKLQKGCIFCQALNTKRKDYVILKSKYSIALLNIYPYNNGHVMVAPIKHIRDLRRLKEEEALDLFRVLNKTTDSLEKILKPDGFNIGLNISRAAGAGITGHLHIHIVPRWIGDANFMTTVSNTRVISQSLKELYRRLKNA